MNVTTCEIVYKKIVRSCGKVKINNNNNNNGHDVKDQPALYFPSSFSLDYGGSSGFQQSRKPFGCTSNDQLNVK